MNKIYTQLAKLYNLVEGDMKIIVYPVITTLVITYMLMFQDYLNMLLLTVEDVYRPLVVAAIALLSGLLGYINKKIASKGEKELIKKNDTKTIQKYELKKKLLEKELELKGEKMV